MYDVGCVHELVRYPVKSMMGTPVDAVQVGTNGLAGDRRFALRRTQRSGANPPGGRRWLTAGRVPELLAYRPAGLDRTAVEPMPTHVQTPGGAQLEIGATALDAELAAQCREPVEIVRRDAGIFDEAPISLISLATIAGIGTEAGLALDHRRFRPNLVVEGASEVPFHEDAWVGARLVIGDAMAGVVLEVTQRDVRCVMITIDPDTGAKAPRVMQAVVDLNDGHAGVYATVRRPGTIRVGDVVRRAPSARTTDDERMS